MRRGTCFRWVLGDGWGVVERLEWVEAEPFAVAAGVDAHPLEVTFGSLLADGWVPDGDAHDADLMVVVSGTALAGGGTVVPRAEWEAESVKWVQTSSGGHGPDKALVEALAAVKDPAVRAALELIAGVSVKGAK